VTALFVLFFFSTFNVMIASNSYKPLFFLLCEQFRTDHFAQFAQSHREFAQLLCADRIHFPTFPFSVYHNENESKYVFEMFLSWI